MNQIVARELAADRISRTGRRQPGAETRHPPSRVRGRAASAVARVAGRLDAESARLALK